MPLRAPTSASSVGGDAGADADTLPWHDYYLAARARADRAHLVIVNHALLLADLATEGRVLPPYRHLIVDETHRLEEAATDQLTYRVEWPVVEVLLRRLTSSGDLVGQLHRAASRAADECGRAALARPGRAGAARRHPAGFPVGAIRHLRPAARRGAQRRRLCATTAARWSGAQPALLEPRRDRVGCLSRGSSPTSSKS